MHPKLSLLLHSAVALGTLLALSRVVGGASAHHALEAAYDTSREEKAVAILARVEWTNPHAWLRFDIPQANGQIEKNVLVETVGIGGLQQLGIDRDGLKVGARYAITFYPNRNGTPGGFMTRLVLPDGGLLAPPSYEQGCDEATTSTDGAPLPTPPPS